MKISIATEGTKVCLHFGHAENFAMFTVEDGKVTDTEKKIPPAHAPGVLPEWMEKNNVDLVIAGGMGPRAQQLFCDHGIDTLIVDSGEVEEVLSEYLAGTLKTSAGACHHPDE